MESRARAVATHALPRLLLARKASRSKAGAGTATRRATARTSAGPRSAMKAASPRTTASSRTPT
eukprot:5487549-Alexandrium_andersonii.AAC.1